MMARFLFFIVWCIPTTAFAIDDPLSRVMTDLARHLREVKWMTSIHRIDPNQVTDILLEQALEHIDESSNIMHNIIGNFDDALAPPKVDTIDAGKKEKFLKSFRAACVRYEKMLVYYRLLIHKQLVRPREDRDFRRARAYELQMSHLSNKAHWTY